MLDFLAGPKALEQIRDRGIHPDDITVVAGAAGGPKWLVLSRLDQTLFNPVSGWWRHRKAPLSLTGSSSGAWRFAAAAQMDPISSINRFEAAYIAQQYPQKPSPSEVSREGLRILERLLGAAGAEEILRHPFLRLNIVTARCRNPLTAQETPYVQALGMATAACFNALHRKALGFFFERVLFHDPRIPSPVAAFGRPADTLPTRSVCLDERNLKPALLASGSIPLVMAGVRDISGAPPGMYRDGGVIDYHMDLPYAHNKGIVLFPHYTQRVIPGWLDKQLPGRQPRYLDNTLIVSPSKTFLNRLPYGKIPDRDDFRIFWGRDRERIAYWREATEMGQWLADEFREAAASGDIRKRIRPYGTG